MNQLKKNENRFLKSNIKSPIEKCIDILNRVQFIIDDSNILKEIDWYFIIYINKEFYKVYRHYFF